MGYVLKLLAIAEKDNDPPRPTRGRVEAGGRISLRVHPSFIDKDNRLAKVDGSFNAISISGSAVGQVMFYGRGAGMMPTASAVVADIIDVALGNSATTFQHLHLRPHSEVAGLISKIDNLVSRFYIRLMVKDQPGVFAQIGKVLADNAISISGVLQHEGRGTDNTVPVVITTHPNRQDKVTAALKGLGALNTVCDKPVCIRIVDIAEDKE
jgi:homoserine dehydrogenase